MYENRLKCPWSPLIGYLSVNSLGGGIADARGVFGKLRLDYFVLGGAGLRGIWGWLWFSCGVAHSGKCLISVFQGFSASIDGAFILAGGLGTGLSFFEVWTVSRYFLIS